MFGFKCDIDVLQTELVSVTILASSVARGLLWNSLAEF
jgi:hypothetical protein